MRSNGRWRCAKRRHKTCQGERGDDHLKRMEPYPGREVVLDIGVMREVQPPQDRNAMKQVVLDVMREIDEDNGEREADQAGQPT